MAKRSDLLVGVDIGTAQVTVVVADAGENGVEITGVGTARSEGLRKGVVVNVDATVQAITRAVREAEVMAGCEIHSAFIGIGGAHIKAFNSHGVVAVKNAEVVQGDVDRVLDAARAVALPLDREIVHVLPQDFVLDGQDGITEPVGMAGVRLEARVHVVSAASLLVQNAVKCCQRAGLHVADIVLTPLAAAEAVLGAEERDQGSALVDMGAGTTDVLVFARGALTHTAVLPLGGNHVTSDIAAGLRTPLRDAELLKRRHGCARVRGVSAAEEVEVPGVGDRASRMVSRRVLCDIIEARMEEIFALAEEQLCKGGLDRTVACGAVLTGGAALVPEAVGLAEKLFRVPTRLGVPSAVGGLPEATTGPEFAAAVGLVLVGARSDSAIGPGQPSGRFGRMGSRVVGWLREFF